MKKKKLEKIDLKQVEALGAFGKTDAEIATIIGISERTLNYYKKNPEFLQAIKKGKLIADYQVEKSLFEKAIHGDTTAMIFWLKNRRPDLWRDRSHHELSGQVGSPDNKLIIEVIETKEKK